MASGASQTYSESKVQFLSADGDAEDEEDSEDVLDPRVKGELERLNSSTAEINRLEHDLEELQATFRQTLTESAYVLKSQATFLGSKCIDRARPYYNAVLKAKQSQIETQKAALKYERACSSHQAAKKMLSIAEQKLVSTSKEHKVLDPTWQEMLNQAVLKVMESDKERALSEKEHLETAQAFSEAGRKVTELKSKLNSAINKSRPYFDLKMKYDQILEAHKRQVEITQASLQEAKQKYSVALKNLEGISEEIHEMRRSRESLDALLLEREEGVGAESPDDTDLMNLEGGTMLQIKPSYGFKIAIVSSTKEAELENSGLIVGERDGDPEGCNSLDEQKGSKRLQESFTKDISESEVSVVCQGENSPTGSSEDVEKGRNMGKHFSNCDSKPSVPDEKWTVVQVDSCASASQDTMEASEFSDNKEVECGLEVQVVTDQGSRRSDDEKCFKALTNQQFDFENQNLNKEMNKDDQESQVHEEATQESASTLQDFKLRKATENTYDVDNSVKSAEGCESNSTSARQGNVESKTSSEVQGPVREEDSVDVTENGQTDYESEVVNKEVTNDNSHMDLDVM